MKYQPLQHPRSKKWAKLYRNRLKNILSEFFTQLIPSCPNHSIAKISYGFPVTDVDHSALCIDVTLKEKIGEESSFTHSDVDKTSFGHGASDWDLRKIFYDGVTSLNFIRSGKDNSSAVTSSLLNSAKSDSDCDSCSTFQEDQLPDIEKSLSGYQVRPLKDMYSIIANAHWSNLQNIIETEFSDCEENFADAGELEPYNVSYYDHVTSSTMIRTEKEKLAIINFGDQEEVKSNVELVKEIFESSGEVVISNIFKRVEPVFNRVEKKDYTLNERCPVKAFPSDEFNNISKIVNSTDIISRYFEKHTGNASTTFKETKELALDSESYILKDFLGSDDIKTNKESEMLLGITIEENREATHELKKQSSKSRFLSKKDFLSKAQITYSNVQKDYDLPLTKRCDPSRSPNRIFKYSKPLIASSVDCLHTNSVEFKNGGTKISNFPRNSDKKLITHSDFYRSSVKSISDLPVTAKMQHYVPALNIDFLNLEIPSSKNKIYHKCTTPFSIRNTDTDTEVPKCTSWNMSYPFNCSLQDTNLNIFNFPQPDTKAQYFGCPQHDSNIQTISCNQQDTDVQLFNFSQHDENSQLFSCAQRDGNVQTMGCNQRDTDVQLFSYPQEDMKTEILNCFQRSTNSQILNSTLEDTKLALKCDMICGDTKHHVNGNPISARQGLENFEEVLSNLEAYLDKPKIIGKSEEKAKSCSATGMAGDMDFSHSKDSDNVPFNTVKIHEPNFVEISEVLEMFEKLHIESNISEIQHEVEEKEISRLEGSNAENRKEKKDLSSAPIHKTPCLKKSRQKKCAIGSSFTYTKQRSISCSITPEFSQKFSKVASYGNCRKSGLVITKERNMQWLSDAGFFNDVIDPDVALKCFEKEAGGKIVLSIYEYVRHLVTLFKGKFWSKNIIDRLSNTPTRHDQ